MAKTKKKKGTADNIHIDINSHNAKGKSNYKMLDDSEGIPHKSKYFIDYKRQGNTLYKYYEKMPKEKYKGTNGIFYMMVNDDNGTILTPLRSIKTGQPVKK